MRSLTRCILSMSILSACSSPVLALAAPGPGDGPLTLEWNARLRHESVDDATFARDANATTLRLRLGLRARLGSGWSALVEGEGVAALADGYNSGANGRTAYPVIADPSGAELNQAWLGWRNEKFATTLGRQRILVDNQRWVGNSGWRQNEQTFDAMALEWKPAIPVTVRYFWLDRVHRINGDQARDPLARERDLNTQLLDVALLHGTQLWGAYVYAHQDQDLATASTVTTGLRWSGTHGRAGRGWGWRVEAAQQRNRADNPLRFSHLYWLLEPSLTWRSVTWRAGWEHLGGDGRHALQTPLATLHAFNGWADKFLVTPANGLDDYYLGAGGALATTGWAAKAKWVLAAHRYRADTGGGGYGKELDASLAYPLNKKLTGLLKLADYHSDDSAHDATKLWLQLEWVQ